MARQSVRLTLTYMSYSKNTIQYCSHIPWPSIMSRYVSWLRRFLLDARATCGNLLNELIYTAFRLFKEILQRARANLHRLSKLRHADGRVRQRGRYSLLFSCTTIGHCSQHQFRGKTFRAMVMKWLIAFRVTSEWRVTTSAGLRTHSVQRWKSARVRCGVILMTLWRYQVCINWWRITKRWRWTAFYGSTRREKKIEVNDYWLPLAPLRIIQLILTVGIRAFDSELMA